MNILFSDKTYQVEIDGTWIFLQLGDNRTAVDRFCTCDEASREGTCAHIDRAIDLIFNGKKEPLHKRFKHSVINQLFFLSARRHGYDYELIKEGNSYLANVGKRTFFRMVVEDEMLQQNINELLYERSEETEATSLKFSNLPKKELEQYRKGRPSDLLRYELSSFSDLAKWFYVFDEPLHIDFLPNLESLPIAIRMKKGAVTLEIALTKPNFSSLLYPLYLQDPTLPIYPYKDRKIDSIRYNRGGGTFEINARIVSSIKLSELETIDLGEWQFIPQRGFIKAEVDPLFASPIIPKTKVGWVLSRYIDLIESILQKEKIHKEEKQLSHHLYFDQKEALHIEAYLFEVGDLKKASSNLYNGWAYIEDKGFFRLAPGPFNRLQTIYKKEELLPFIEKYRFWLAGKEGFQIHASQIEAHMSYRMTATHLLIEPSEEQDNTKGVIDLIHWLYVQGSGFYPKGRKNAIRATRESILKEDIAFYIRENREECESIRGFFAPKSLFKKTALSITAQKGQEILIEPQYIVDSMQPIEIFKEFIYIQELGFIEIPPEYRLPDRYQTKQTILADEIPYFLGQELQRLLPSIGYLDPKIRTPQKLDLVLVEAKKENERWALRLVYRSEIGEISLKELDTAIRSLRQYYLSEAGALNLKDPKFQWLQKGGKKGIWIELSPLEWLKIKVFEGAKIDLQEGVEWIEFLEANESNLAEPDLSLLKSQLRPYQLAGAKWLFNLYQFGFSGLLCDDMGLGKTHQAMSSISSIKQILQNYREPKFLVVAPTSVMYHWERLLQTFLPSFSVHLHHGQGREAPSLNQDILVTSYGILRSDKELFKNLHFDLAIFDEMQVAKNHTSLIHKALLTIDAKMRLGLSGTPIENRLLELKSLIDIILPKFLPSDVAFKELFINPIEKGQDGERANLLMRLIKPFILRRKKSDVLLDLPEKIEELLVVDLSDEQKQLYRSLYYSSKQTIDHELSEENNKNACIHIFALLTKLKQLCNHPALILQDVANYKNHQSGKWDLFVELIQDAKASNQKVVVFSQFLEMLNIIERYLEEEGIAYAAIRGSTRDRKGEVERFQTDPNCLVFVGSIHAAGVGIDLTQASCVIHYDRWWNFAKENQATDRVHRIGQTRGVQVFKIMSKETIEEDINWIIESKRELAEQVLSYDSADEEKQLSQEELMLLMNRLADSVEKMGKG